MLFDHCATCQSCCNVDTGFGTLEITLTQKETKVFRHLCIEDRCEYLGEKGCNLGDRKPLSCQLYPLSFDPQVNQYYFDAACPLLPEYKRQLKDSDSDASKHFLSMNTLIEEMSVVDPKFLSRNHEIDLDFFELVPLSQPSHLKQSNHERKPKPSLVAEDGNVDLAFEDCDMRVGYQTWNQDNLCVESYHGNILYYTSRWDALCPYIDVTPEMLEMAAKPFIVYAVSPESPYGVPINDKYGLVDVAAEGFWTEPRRQRKFKELEKLCNRLTVTESVVPGHTLTIEDVNEMGGMHFEAYYIHPEEVAGFVDYIQNLDVLIIRAFSEEGDLALTDVSILLPERKQVYGSFCQWNPLYKNRSPGIFACLLASKWAAKNGYHSYNLGPVDGYGYKALFVTHFEPIFAVAMTDVNHPLALDKSSPLHTDFSPNVWNRINRKV